MVTKKKFSGWGVLVAAILLSFVPTGLLSNCFSLYMNPICSDLGFSNASWSVIALIASLASAIGSMLVAGWYKKKNMNVWMAICIVVTAGMTALSAFCTQIWQFYIVFGICNIFCAGITQLPISMLITAWFEDKRSVAMSVAFAGSGIGTAIWSPILTKFITASATGWKDAMLFSAAVVLVVMLIADIFLVKRSPAEFGQEPYRQASKKDAGEASEQKKASWVGVSKKIATKSKAWLCEIGVVLFIGALASGITTHVPNYLVDIGWTSEEAALSLSLYSVVSIVAVVGGGILFDKAGLKIGAFVAALFIVIGMVCLILAESIPLIGWGYSIFFALAMCIPRLLPSILCSEVFGTKDYGGLYALQNVFFLLGAAIGSVLTGIISDILGYNVAWVIYAVFGIFSFLCVAGAISGGKKLREKYPNGDE